MPALLEERLYHADGQIHDEVYVYGSFVQSKMHREGVTCSDCHDPHSLELLAPGNALCHRCHAPERYDTPDHHFHESGTPGAQCVECHMPARTYMVVDPRRDHSMRVPRPDLSITLQTPNACNQCHDDQTPAWAADAIERWYGPERRREPHFGQALHAGRLGAPRSTPALAELIRDLEQPGIARATALSLLPAGRDPVVIESVRAGVEDDDPLIRSAAARALRTLPVNEAMRLGSRLLADPVRAVRIEAARSLAELPVQDMPRDLQSRLVVGIGECIEAELVNAERPEAHMSVGLLRLFIGQLDLAEAAYRTALRLDPRFAPAYANLADLQRMRGRDDEAVRLLRQGLDIAPADAALHHALGLVQVRRGERVAALESLRRAREIDGTNARYAYAYGLALLEAGDGDQALDVLDTAHREHPYDRDILIALATICRDRGARELALDYARRLVELDPSDPGAFQLLQELGGR
jgi:Flp pilus assembly protein TadD